MTAPVNGTPPAAQQPADPQKIATEVYILDGLIAAIHNAAGQLRFRGKTKMADQIDNLAVLVAPGQAMLLQAFREQFFQETYGKTESGLLLAGPGDLPPPRA